MASVPNRSFITCTPVLNKNEDGLNLDFDSDNEGVCREDNDKGDNRGCSSPNTKKRKKHRQFKP